MPLFIWEKKKEWERELWLKTRRRENDTKASRSRAATTNATIARFESTLTRFMIGLNFKRKRLSTTTCRGLDAHRSLGNACAQRINLCIADRCCILPVCSQNAFSRIRAFSDAHTHTPVRNKKRKGITRIIASRVKPTREIAWKIPTFLFLTSLGADVRIMWKDLQLNSNTETR